jgi:hypothetical protein
MGPELSFAERPPYIGPVRSRSDAVTRLSLAAAALVPALLAFAPAAFAQDTTSTTATASGAASGDRVSMVIVYGNDTCPQPRGDEITVCARKSESERYRIPEELRGSDSPRNDAWNNKVLAYEMVGRTGTQSCSPVGGGGFTGCAQQMINKAYAEKGQDPGIHFSELIAAERARRTATIDQDAAETQARVEQEERDYDKRKAGEQQGQAPAPAQPTSGQ